MLPWAPLGARIPDVDVPFWGSSSRRGMGIQRPEAPRRCDDCNPKTSNVRFGIPTDQKCCGL